MPEADAVHSDASDGAAAQSRDAVRQDASSTPPQGLWRVLARRRRLVAMVVGGSLALCLLYCLIAPNQYEASAKVALRTAPASALNVGAAEPAIAASILSAPVQQETLASVLRSDQLAWKVILDRRLYQAPAFMGRFAARFPGFRPDANWPAAQGYLLERFADRLHVQTLPRSLVIRIRFRTRDAALSADVVSALIRAYQAEEAEARLDATLHASEWLAGQLKELKSKVDANELRLAAYQREHGLLATPETLANGQEGETEHTSALLEVDELGRQLVAATTERILREAEYHAATAGDPELVLASDSHLQTETGNLDAALLGQIRSQKSVLEQEQAQLSSEHGPNFPRVVEIRQQLKDLEAQKQAEDAKLVDRFRGAWQTAADREKMVRRSLEEQTAEGMKANQAAAEYAAMREEANASRAVYVQLRAKAEEAGLAAGVYGSSIAVVDPARAPAKPVAPDLPLYLAITLFVSLWLAVGGALSMETLSPASARGAALLLVGLAVTVGATAQPPTPNTSGLPSGVVRLPAANETRQLPDPREAASGWNGAGQVGVPATAAQLGTPMPAPIGPGDSLDVTEYHTPEFHTAARVSASGEIALPMVDEVKVAGMDEQQAAHAIEAALSAKGMLLHPRVSVLVTSYAGQDVSVLGEVARPGVYPFTMHHRLLDLISAASGLSPTAGRLVNIFHREDPKTPHPVVLDPGGTDSEQEHNPELAPGDTVQVSRAGLVYVIGDVVRPGGFAVDPAQGLTVVQALSLAWGPAQNASTGKALLIREQKGGRTLTQLNLKRMLHGEEPDQPVHDRDILFVPDSAARNLWNRTAESIIQSAVGVTIYSALVYSQRY
ncbi:MAG: polysaccharide biosynthesis/export family protein [Terracidiphilus sp.]